MAPFEVLNVQFLQRIGIDLLGLALLVWPALTSRDGERQGVFIHIMFGIGVFFVTYILRMVEMSLGFAFGLFAIFSMLRYRTENLSTRDMTYLFLVIVISLLCAVARIAPLELLAVVGLMVGLARLVDLLPGPSLVQQVRYEKIDNIRPRNRAALLQDLRARTGLDVVGVTIQSIDFMQDSALLLVRYRSADTAATFEPDKSGLEGQTLEAR